MPEKPVPFDPTAAQEVLGALSARIDDAKHGQGNLLMTGGGQTLEVFSDAVRVTGPDFTVEVTGQPLTPDVGPDWVGFRGTADGMTRFVALRNTGEVTFSKTAPKEVYRAEQAELERQAAALPAEGVETAGQPGTTPPAAEAERSPERGKPVSFTGRIGRDPRVFESDGKLRIKLAVAEHVIDEGSSKERTVWHEVWTTDNLAPKVAEQIEARTLTQGVEVAVKGYQHRHAPVGRQKEGKLFVRAFTISPVKRNTA